MYSKRGKKKESLTGIQIDTDIYEKIKVGYTYHQLSVEPHFRSFCCFVSLKRNIPHLSIYSNFVFDMNSILYLLKI